MAIFYIILFLISCALFFFAGKIVVDGLIKATKFLKLKEFIVAFFVMAFAASLPNLIVGLSAAARGIPQLSFGDVTGNNLAALTLIIAITCFFTKRGIVAESKTVQISSYFVMASALLPLILIGLDGTLSRTDGVFLILLFFFYAGWLFSKKERFNKPSEECSPMTDRKFKLLLKSLLKVALGLVIFIVAAQGMVVSAQFFAKFFNMSIILIGILITGLGSALPEMYFDSVSAKKGKNWMILGDLMGAIIVPSTLVLGIVAIISPIRIYDFSSLALARVFIVIAAIAFPIMVRTKKEISKKEAIVLLFIYIAFLISEILLKDPIMQNSSFNFLWR